MSNKQEAIWVVIPAAGVGKRMQADRPKQYLPLLDKCVIEQTIACFSSHPKISGIIIALSPDDPYWKDLNINCDKPLYTIDGGNERCDSVLNALIYLKSELALHDDSWVMVHDAARPCLSQEDLNKLITALENSAVGGILASPVRDTMKRSSDSNQHIIHHTENRDNLWHALTPQMFRFALLFDALQQALDNNISITDDASAIEYLGLPAELIEGDASNIKITKPSDLALAEFFLSRAKESV